MLKAQKNLPKKGAFLYKQKNKKSALSTYFSIKNIHIYDYHGQKKFEKFKNADHEAQMRQLSKITDEIEQFIREENNNSDAADGAFDVLSDLAESVQEDFEELIDADSDKKIFLSRHCQRSLHCY